MMDVVATHNTSQKTARQDGFNLYVFCLCVAF